MRIDGFLSTLRFGYLPTSVTLALVAGLAAVAGSITYHWVHEQNRARFQLRAQDRLMIMHRAIESNLEVIHSIQGLFASNPKVTREEFKRGMADSLNRRPEIQALEWMVRVPHSLRSTFENEMQREGFSGLRISELNEQGQRVVAPARPEYFVIFYAEPLQGNSAALGYNIWASPKAREALSAALEGKIGISSWLPLSQGEVGFVVYLPLKGRRWPRPGKQASESPARPETFAVGVFRIKRLFEVALQDMPTADVDFLVSDQEGGGSKAQYFRYTSQTGKLGEATAEDWEKAERLKMTWRSSIPVAERKWAVQFFPSESYKFPYSPAIPPAVTLAFLFVGILIALFGNSVRQTQTIARLLAQESAARQSAESALKLREEFLAIASHELRTPVTPLKIQLFLVRKLITEQLPAGDTAKSLLRTLDMADKQLDRLLRLIRDLLDVSRMTEGKLTIQPETFDLGQLVRELAESFCEEFNRSGCSIRIRADRPVVGNWDRVRVEQVILNLLMNAVKFGAGKPIDVAVEVDQDERWALLHVRDYGIGVAAEEQSRIFGRFERAVSSSSFAGLGLGLYIAHQIITAHGGQISISSRTGEGATFTVKLPLQPAESGTP